MRHTTTTTPDATASANSLCRSIGHDWRSTTAPDYRICRRRGCKAGERFFEGQWVAATARLTAQPSAAAPRQIVMPWATSDPATLWNIDQPRYQQEGATHR